MTRVGDGDFVRDLVLRLRARDGVLGVAGSAAGFGAAGTPPSKKSKELLKVQWAGSNKNLPAQGSSWGRFQNSNGIIIFIPIWNFLNK